MLAGNKTYAEEDIHIPLNQHLERLLKSERGAQQLQGCAVVDLEELKITHAASAMLTRLDRSQSMSRLTPRKREVLGLMAEGRSNAAIADKLFVTAKAVDKHVNSIFMKLD